MELVDFFVPIRQAIVKGSLLESCLFLTIATLYWWNGVFIVVPSVSVWPPLFASIALFNLLCSLPWDSKSPFSNFWFAYCNTYNFLHHWHLKMDWRKHKIKYWYWKKKKNIDYKILICLISCHLFYFLRNVFMWFLIEIEVDPKFTVILFGDYLQELGVTN